MRGLCLLFMPAAAAWARVGSRPGYDPPSHLIWPADPSVDTRFLLSLPPCYRMVFFLEDVMACTKRLLEWIAGWLPRHFIGAILVSLPALAVYSHITSEFETNIHVRKGLTILFLNSLDSFINSKKKKKCLMIWVMNLI